MDEDPSQRIATVYDDATIQRIAERHRVEGPLIEELEWWIRKGALRALIDQQQRAQQSEGQEEQSERQTRRRRMARLAAALLTEVEAEEQDGDPALWQLMHDLSEEFAMRPPASFSEDWLEATLTGHASKCETKFTNTILRLACEMLAENAPKKRGTKPNQGLDEFACYVADFYEDKLARRFTLDQHRGEPTTPGFDFLRDCVSPLFEVPTSRLVTAAKRAIAERRSSRVSDGPSEKF